MIIWRSTYDELEEKYKDTLESLRVAKHNLSIYKRDFENLTNKLNPKGGWNFVNNAVLLSQEDIQKLILLCHPDKHDGKPMANEMTKKLLGMRK